MILSLLTSKLSGPIATGAAVLFLAFGMSQCSGRLKAEGKIAAAERKAETAEKKRKVAQANYELCAINREQLEGAVKTQNAAVEALKLESDKRAQALTKARQVAEKEAQRADRAVSKLAGFKIPDGERCARLLAVDEVVKGAN